jgi:general secretion pathway protein K
MPTSNSTSKNQQGAVVILILLILTALSCLAIELSKETLVDHASSTVLTSTIRGNSLCDSGRLLAKHILLEDLSKTTSDHPFETWGNFDKTLRDTSHKFTTGVLTGRIEDENGRFPINNIVLHNRNKQQTSTYQNVFLRLLKQQCEQLNITSGTPEDLLLSIRIWQGEELTRSKEDDAWYKAQQPPYIRPKRPFASPDEFLLLRWPNATKKDLEKLFYGTSSCKGLRELTTIWGAGPVNINTTVKDIYAALPETQNHTAEFANGMIMYQTDPSNSFENDWYLLVAEQCGIKNKSLPINILGHNSNTFRVTLTANTGAGRRSETVIVRRTKKGVIVLAAYGNS